MKEWVRNVLAPWRAKFLQAHQEYDEDQLMIGYIDLYPVHTGEDFRIFQPADVGLQRVGKHILHQDSLDYLVDCFKAQSKKGVAPKDVKFPSSLPILRNATVRGLVKMYDYFQTPEGRKIVQQAWRKCEVPGTDWNLSAECLTGKSSDKALREYLREDSTLATEIANRCGTTHLDQVLLTSPSGQASDNSPLPNAAPEESFADFDSHDDSDVPFNAVVRDALGIDVATLSHGTTFVGSRTAQTEEGAEDIWAYTDSGIRWDEVEELETTEDA
ncbi:hypothetical protein B0H16DRAFT_1737746 [Mycena metata]|uniref:Uncharacterized protein n=1 Tax=Mycena metata TaxID=1033252 RepID=A0AAD7HJT6_9AGAR|nr:hypothetical protein B0H16DRAFT_1737746 [Mycena metata]